MLTKTLRGWLLYGIFGHSVLGGLIVLGPRVLKDPNPAAHPSRSPFHLNEATDISLGLHLLFFLLIDTAADLIHGLTLFIHEPFLGYICQLVYNQKVYRQQLKQKRMTSSFENSQGEVLGEQTSQFPLPRSRGHLSSSPNSVKCYLDYFCQ